MFDESTLLVEPLTNLFSEISNDERFWPYSKCPAAALVLKDTYVVRSPISMRIRRNQDGSFYDINGAPQKVVDNYIREDIWPNKPECSHLIQIGLPSLKLISDEPVDVLQLPPFLHDTPINQYKVLPGSFDVSKWFRDLHLACLIRSDQDFIVNKGDPMIYLQFRSLHKIKLQEFEYTPKINSYAEQILKYRDIFKGNNLTFFYNAFTKAKMLKRILREVRNNLI